MTTKWSVVSWMSFGKQKEDSKGKTSEILMECVVQLIAVDQHWFLRFDKCTAMM